MASNLLDFSNRFNPIDGRDYLVSPLVNLDTRFRKQFHAVYLDSLRPLRAA